MTYVVRVPHLSKLLSFDKVHGRVAIVLLVLIISIRFSGRVLNLILPVVNTLVVHVLLLKDRAWILAVILNVRWLLLLLVAVSMEGILMLVVYIKYRLLQWDFRQSVCARYQRWATHSINASWLIVIKVWERFSLLFTIVVAYPWNTWRSTINPFVRLWNIRLHFPATNFRWTSLLKVLVIKVGIIHMRWSCFALLSTIILTISRIGIWVIWRPLLCWDSVLLIWFIFPQSILIIDQLFVRCIYLHPILVH